VLLEPFWREGTLQSYSGEDTSSEYHNHKSHCKESDAGVSGEPSSLH
jgi:hypothetical protein